MHVELHDHLDRPVSLPATRVVIYNDLGDPVVLAVSRQPGHMAVFRVDDDDFNEQLRMHGIDKTVIVTTMPARPAGR